MISSTARDLPQHRKQAIDACLRMGMFPIMMEHLPASDEEAVSASIRMVDEADIYLLLLAQRYGYIPKKHNAKKISLTEMEYDRALERKIPRLVLLMDDDHSIKAADVETGEGAAKLERFKNRVGIERVRDKFISPEDLRGKLIHAFIPFREHNLDGLHHISDVPSPPHKYVAHPYTLLQTHKLIGRQAELQLLTDWIRGNAVETDGHNIAADSVRIMSLVAIGGMGKSALTWKWFHEVAPQEMKFLTGRLWWSFYESDATFENFVIRSLAYVSTRTIADVQKIPAHERESQLFAALDRNPFLIVLDGLERILIAYARMDASRLDDGKIGKERPLRKTIDPSVGRFLQKLSQVDRSRILVSSRLYPAELETVVADPIPGTFVLKLDGLSDDDAMDLWRTFCISGSRRELMPVFMAFAKHPLLIQALAGEVRRYRKAPGNFEEWRKTNRQFEPSKFSRARDAMGHVLEFALRGLNEKTQKVLSTIAAFRMPAGYNTLAALLIQNRGRNLCKSEPELDQILSELEDRALLGWDKHSNRYDLHPIVRAVVWESLKAKTRSSIFKRFHHYFSELECSDEPAQTLDDLTPAIELYSSLLELKRFFEAYQVYQDRLHESLKGLGALRVQIELLQPLLQNTSEGFPRLEDAQGLFEAMTIIAEAFSKTGQCHNALHFLCCAHSLSVTAVMLHGPYPWVLCDVSHTLLLAGHLYGAYRAAIDAKSLPNWDSREGLALLGAVCAACGNKEKALEIIINLRSEVFTPKVFNVREMWAIAQGNLWINEFKSLFTYVTAEFNLGSRNSHIEYIWAKRLKGEAALGLQDLKGADVLLYDALAHARAVGLVVEELPVLVALAELRRRQENLKAARECLGDVWEPAEVGPYRLVHADAFNILAQIERDALDKASAIEAATKAYRLAWCDGPPFAYHLGLEKAKQHLRELGAPEPDMPQFAESEADPIL